MILIKIDRRIIRSKSLLINAMRELISLKRFKGISVREISDLSTVNRATFYKHYTDKDALLEDVIKEDFSSMLKASTAEATQINKELLKNIICTVALFLKTIDGRRREENRSLGLLEEKVVQQIIAEYLLEMLEKGAKREYNVIGLRIKAIMASRSIYVAVSQWMKSSKEKTPGGEDLSMETLLEMILNPIAGLIK